MAIYSRPCSYDRKVIIWKEENGTWEKTHEHTGPRLLRYSAGAGGDRAAVGGSIYSGGKVLKPEANTKQNKKSKRTKTVGWLVFSCKVYSFQVLVFVLRV